MKGRKRERATAANKRVFSLEAELVTGKDAHERLIDILAQSVADAAKARADLENCKARSDKVVQEANTKSADLKLAQRLPVESI